MSTNMLKEHLIVGAMRKISSTSNTILPMITNRNPRNLERMRLARKPSGYSFDKKNVEYWHKLQLLATNKHLIASLIHNTGTTVLSVSTQEWSINKFLYKPKDMCAHIVLAKVLAERCMESGITHCFADIKAKDNTKVAAFLKTLEEEGLTLAEPNAFNIHAIWKTKPEKKPWLVRED